MRTGVRNLLVALWLVAAAPRCLGYEAPRPLRIFAAASLSEAFAEIGKEFEQSNPGSRLEFNFAGSQQLAMQVEQGASADVFASADTRWMEYLEHKSLLSGRPQVFLHNRLVVIIPKSNPGGVGELKDLARPGLKLVLAADAVPVGRYSRQCIQKLDKAPGFGNDWSQRLMRNVVSGEENVRAVAAKVQLGEADAGIVYQSDVNSSLRSKIRMVQIPEAFNIEANYAIAVLRQSRNPGAHAFVVLVLSASGQRILKEYGFIPVAPQ